MSIYGAVLAASTDLGVINQLFAIDVVCKPPGLLAFAATRLTPIVLHNRDCKLLRIAQGFPPLTPLFSLLLGQSWYKHPLALQIACDLFWGFDAAQTSI